MKFALIDALGPVMVALFLSTATAAPVDAPIAAVQAVSVDRHGVPTVGNTTLFGLHKVLMQIESISGNETRATDFLVGFLRGLGWTVETQPVQNPVYPNARRENLYAYVGKTRNVSLVLASHVDTVPPFVPYSEDANNIYGRGANDAKGQVVAQIVAAENLRRKGYLKEGQLGLLYTVGEEVGGDGIVAAYNTGLNPTYMLIGEPTENAQATGHKGGMRVRVDSFGQFAHGSVPEAGRNAIYQLVDAIDKLRNITDKLPSSDFFGKTTLSVNIIEGGIVGNQVPARASATVDVRTAVANATEVFNVIKSELNSLPYINVTEVFSVDPLKFDLIKDWGARKVMPYGTDYLRWKGRGLRFLLGPGSITTAHTDHEVISKKELRDAVRYYTEFVTGVLNGTLVIENVGTFPRG